MNDQIFIELIKTIPTFIVGLIAARIAWQQSRTAQEQKRIAEAKLKFDLFQKRIDFYEAFYTLAESAKSYKNHKEALNSLKTMIPLANQAGFLFGEDVQELVEEMCKKVAILGQAIGATAENDNVVPKHVLSKVVEANNWIKQAPIKETFKPYLDLSSWR